MLNRHDSVHCPNACLCHAFGTSKPEAHEEEDITELDLFEAVDIDKDVEENDWTVLFPETTVIEIHVRPPRFP